MKEDVGLPDWRDEERLRHTNVSADYLAAIMPEGLTGSDSTEPGAFKTFVTSDDMLARSDGDHRLAIRLHSPCDCKHGTAAGGLHAVNGVILVGFVILVVRHRDAD